MKSLDNKIIKTYKHLIYKIVNKIYRQIDGDIYDDLIQAGYEALLKAYKSYNKNKGSLSNYLFISLTRKIRQEYNNQKNIITIPRHVMDYASYLYKAKAMFNSKQEVINYLVDNSNLTLGRANTLYDYIIKGQPLILDSNILDTFNKQYNDLDLNIDTERMITLVKYHIQFLTSREQQIIRLHYIDNHLSFTNIAKILNIKESLCWNTHHIAIRRLRKRVLSKLKRKGNYGISTTTI